MSGEENTSKQGVKERNNNNKSRKVHINRPEDSTSKKGVLKRNKHRRLRKGHLSSAKEDPSENLSKISHKDVKSPKFSKHLDASKKASTLRKRVDPETAKYFSEIANLFESNEVDLEERSTICGNALEETRGKEVELATDVIISRTLQCLLEGCDLDQLCGFLQTCSKGFSSIAMDKCGSHVAETALKSLAIHLQDEGSYSIIEETLTKICQVVVVDSVNVMCDRYGSHVLRSLLCLCKGVPLDSLGKFHVTKPSDILAERLNFKPTQSGGNTTKDIQHSLPVLFRFLVREMLHSAKDEIVALRVNNYSSFVFQTALKLLVGDDEELLQSILILLGCHEKNIAQERFIETERKYDILALLEDTASSHLLEVIIEVAPESLYNELLHEVFKGSLYKISSHHCGNFVVQALVSSASTRDQVELIWVELGPTLKELLEGGKSGVIASILSACQRLQTRAHECCKALAAAVSSEPESSSCIVPHLLFLESYFREKSCWKWPICDKMHILGCLMLQTIFKYSKHCIQPYSKSITSMEADQIYQTANDTGGGRVLEAFLCSDASAKQKLQVITKLQDHFGELSMHPSSSFTVEKCFAASNLTMKEAIAVELLAVQTELSKTKHGPYLLRKLDIDGFGRKREQWKLSQATKDVAYKEFQATFGSTGNLQEHNALASPSSQKSLEKKRKRHEKVSDDINRGLDARNAKETQSLGPEFPGLEISMAKLGFPGQKLGPKRRKSAGATVGKNGSNTFIRTCQETPFVRKSGKRISSATELADLAGKRTLSAGDVRKLFKPNKSEMELAGNGRTSFLKKQKR